jgi:SAM-dependent methyltransferase
MSISERTVETMERTLRAPTNSGPPGNELIEVACNLCGSGDAVPIDQQRGYRMVECRQCGLVYLSPRPTGEWLVAAYQEYLPADTDPIVQWNRMMAPLYSAARRRLIGRFPTGGCLLDVGCAFGYFLETMRTAGWRVDGLEISKPAVAACRRLGFEVAETTLSGADLSPVRYDAVTLFYVLEHLGDPMGGLRKIRAAMKPGGLCLIRVPHTTPLVRALKRVGIRTELYDPPYHLFDYSPAVLRRMLRETGFQNVRIEIDAATRPARLLPGIVSVGSSLAGRIVQCVSGGRLLLPGVSKTVLAEK